MKLDHVQTVLLTRQTHDADRAGRHYDYRIVVGDKALSWATKKELPEDGKPIILWEQPVHTREYALSKKVIIPPGNYGSGTTTLDFVRKAKLEEKEPGHLSLITNSGEKYLLKQVPNFGEGAWLFKRTGLQKKSSLMEKIAILIQQYQHKETGKTKWATESKAKDLDLNEYVLTGHKKYIKRKV